MEKGDVGGGQCARGWREGGRGVFSGDGHVIGGWGWGVGAGAFANFKRRLADALRRTGRERKARG